MFASNITLTSIHIDDKELFRKCREIWNKINELLGIDDPTVFVRTTLYDDKSIMLETEKNTSAVTDKYRNDLAFAFHSVWNEFLQSSLVQYRY